MSGQIPLFGSEPGQDLPQVYVATRLTHLDQDGQSLVASWCYVIRGAIEQLADDGWWPRLHLPVKQSAPWKEDGMTADEVYHLNSGLLWRDVDALIVLTYGGGSLGAGHEPATALQLGIPTLVISQAYEPLSRHVRGLAREHAVPHEVFTEPERLRDIVDAWMRAERRRIDDGPRRRRTRAVRMSRIAEHLTLEWRRLNPAGRREVEALSGVAITRIERMLAFPEHLDAASFHEVAGVAGALAIDLERVGLGAALPDLDNIQLRALAGAAEEYGWSARDALELERAARVELAEPAIRRIRLTSMQDWLRFAEIHRST